MPNQVQKIAKMLYTCKNWQLIQTIDTCQLVKNCACRCHTPEGKKLLKNSKSKECPCQEQSANARNSVKGKKHTHLRVVNECVIFELLNLKIYESCY